MCAVLPILKGISQSQPLHGQHCSHICRVCYMFQRLRHTIDWNVNYTSSNLGRVRDDSAFSLLQLEPPRNQTEEQCVDYIRVSILESLFTLPKPKQKHLNVIDSIRKFGIWVSTGAYQTWNMRSLYDESEKTAPATNWQIKLHALMKHPSYFAILRPSLDPETSRTAMSDTSTSLV